MASAEPSPQNFNTIIIPPPKDIKTNYGIEFEEYSSKSIPGYWEFRNITDDRDVTLCIVKSEFNREEH